MDIQALIEKAIADAVATGTLPAAPAPVAVPTAAPAPTDNGRVWFGFSCGPETAGLLGITATRFGTEKGDNGAVEGVTTLGAITAILGDNFRVPVKKAKAYEKAGGRIGFDTGSQPIAK